MGNCYGSSSVSTTNPGTQEDNNNNNNNNNMGSPVTSSTSTTATTGGNKSQFSAATSTDQVGSFEDNQLVKPNGQILESPNLKVFSFSDLKAATKNFKPDSLLGQGGFGKVYKGWIDERTLAPTKPGIGMVVAVKKLNPDSESGQGFREWQAEVNFLGRLSHPNLVKLLGYCWESEELLLVYEFMQKGSLENHLFRRGMVIEPLLWHTRLKIAIGAARGLAFLHSSEKHIIYRDFKASNILLDGDYNAKISDFGLAKLGPSGGDTHVSTRIIGTHGYAAPEYIATGHLYVKSDVYGFGVVLLEMLTGLRAVDRSRPQQNLVDWMKPILQKRKVKTIMDPKMEGQYSTKAIMLAANLILKCLEHDPKRRPSMDEIVAVLSEIQAIKEKPKLITMINNSTRPGSSLSSSSSTTNHRGHRSPLH